MQCTMHSSSARLSKDNIRRQWTWCTFFATKYVSSCHLAKKHDVGSAHRVTRAHIGDALQTLKGIPLWHSVFLEPVFISGTLNPETAQVEAWRKKRWRDCKGHGMCWGVKCQKEGRGVVSDTKSVRVQLESQLT